MSELKVWQGLLLGFIGAALIGIATGLFIVHLIQQ